ncbi:hypothetical protein AAW14_24505 [Streptomyces hygroscopicus]|uniref:hypothetical protein n=1 Tax=Streptomyces hygroscopicus TaxID=1912 RepID=UPI0022402BAD|nr:hypothetical protein [Streptomyces hygroscopicus]MCW7945088.1 hypothetical protein [Streptomyces hygroscopicus]
MSVTAFAPETEARFALARQVADAVLFEGHVLRPNRVCAAGNRLRWQFGVLVPPAWGADRDEHDFQHTECLMEPTADATLAVELRFLRAKRHTVQRARPDGGFETVPELRLGDRVLAPWDEGTEERVEAVVTPAELIDGEGVTLPFGRPADEECERVLDDDGHPVGRTVGRREEINGVLRLSARELDAPFRVMRLTAVVENTSLWAPADGRVADRDVALPRCLVAAHLLMGLSGGEFLSMTNPPEWAKGAVASCRNLHTWPVLACDAGHADVVLSSPIVLEDHPAVAPDNPGTSYGATGTDGTLAPGGPRDMTRTAASTGFPDEYGVMRPDTPWEAAVEAGFDPAHDRVVVAGRSVGAGSRVRLNPGLRRTDAQDLFLRGRTAKVEAVLHDVDGSVHLAVTVEDDPGADVRRAQGSFLYFRTDEVTPVVDGK